ncbi:hypothetical protein CATMIT_01646, partial [Catenibacterium mitsuokai DSM 15897]
MPIGGPRRTRAEIGRRHGAGHGMGPFDLGAAVHGLGQLDAASPRRFGGTHRGPRPAHHPHCGREPIADPPRGVLDRSHALS